MLIGDYSEICKRKLGYCSCPLCQARVQRKRFARARATLRTRLRRLGVLTPPIVKKKEESETGEALR